MLSWTLSEYGEMEGPSASLEGYGCPPPMDVPRAMSKKAFLLLDFSLAKGNWNLSSPLQVSKVLPAGERISDGTSERHFCLLNWLQQGTWQILYV